MHADRTMPEQKLDLPPDLVAELKRRGSTQKVDMGVEGLKQAPSFFGRIIEMFTGRRSR
jgi:hypothetical protein